MLTLSDMIYSMSDTQMFYIIAVMAFITLDYVSGVVSAIVEKKLSSKRMKAGLLKKFGYILLLCLCYMIDLTTVRMRLGFTTEIFSIVSAGICMIEITSILENICIINPDIKASNILDIFNNKKYVEEKKDNNDAESN